MEVTETVFNPEFADADDRKDFEVTENSKTLLIGQVEATDADDDTLTYTLSGQDAGFFRIVTTTGELYSKEPLDHESSDADEGRYTVTVSASDGEGAAGTITVNIDVIDVNEAPMFATETAVRSVNENEPLGTEITNVVTAMDPEGNPLTYSLSGTDAASFAIERNIDGDGH